MIQEHSWDSIPTESLEVWESLKNFGLPWVEFLRGFRKTCAIDEKQAIGADPVYHLKICIVESELKLSVWYLFPCPHSAWGELRLDKYGTRSELNHFLGSSCTRRILQFSELLYCDCCECWEYSFFL